MLTIVSGVAAVFVLAALAGCSSLINVNERALQIQDIIDMTAAGTGPDVIIRQIEVTGSRFQLTTDDIIALKNAKVDEAVIEAMIESDGRRGYGSSAYGYPYPGYWYDSHYFGGWAPVGSYPPYWHNYYGPPYTVYRQQGLIGRFYQYGPAPRWDASRNRWITPFDTDNDRNNSDQNINDRNKNDNRSGRRNPDAKSDNTGRAGRRSDTNGKTGNTDSSGRAGRTSGTDSGDSGNK